MGDVQKGARLFCWCLLQSHHGVPSPSPKTETHRHHFPGTRSEKDPKAISLEVSELTQHGSPSFVGDQLFSLPPGLLFRRTFPFTEYKHQGPIQIHIQSDSASTNEEKPKRRCPLANRRTCALVLAVHLEQLPQCLEHQSPCLMSQPWGATTISRMALGPNLDEDNPVRWLYELTLLPWWIEPQDQITV